MSVVMVNMHKPRFDNMGNLKEVYKEKTVAVADTTGGSVNLSCPIDIVKTQIKGANIIKEPLKHLDDDVDIYSSLGTLAFINTEYQFYGYIEANKIKGDKVKIIWISIADFEADPKKRYISNRKGKLVDVTELGIKALNHGVLLKKVQCSSTIKIAEFNTISMINFKKRVGLVEDCPETEVKEQSEIKDISNLKNIESKGEEEQETQSLSDITEAKKEEQLEKSDEQSKTEANSTENTDGVAPEQDSGIDKYSEIFSMLQKITEYIHKDTETNKQIASTLIDKQSKANSIIAKLDGAEYEEKSTALLDVIDIATSDNITEEPEINSIDTMYEMHLRLLKTNDTVTIDKEYLNHLQIIVKKYLEQNMSMSYSKSIALIRFDRDSKYNICAVIECDDSKKDMRITVLKPYSKKELSDDDIHNYYLRYKDWLRRNNYFYRE